MSAFIPSIRAKLRILEVFIKLSVFEATKYISVLISTKFMYSEEQRADMLNLAREAIKTYIEQGDTLKLSKDEVPDFLKETRATFVTITIDHQLRGCIGSLEPKQELYKDIIENAVNASFNDPRFPELTDEEFRNITIEISVLTPPKKLEYENTQDLLKNIERNKHGIILSKDGFTATFLPQVWEQLPTKEEFLTHLCLKANLAPNAYTQHPEIQLYEVESFEESS